MVLPNNLYDLSSLLQITTPVEGNVHVRKETEVLRSILLSLDLNIQPWLLWDSTLGTDFPGVLVLANPSLGLKPESCILFSDKAIGEVTASRAV